jgi:hypothetical protein
MGEMRLTAALLTVRALPGIVTRRYPLRRAGEAPLYETLASSEGFVSLEEQPQFLVAGYVGQPWRLTGGNCPVSSRDEFAGFGEPGYAKVVTYFDARPAGEGSVLRTETRIHLTDQHARRSFGRYWFVVRWGSLAQRKDWLRAARRRAERAHSQPR